MRLTTLLLALPLAFSVLGFLGGPNGLKADEPAPCKRYVCDMVHAHWDLGSRDEWAQAYFFVDTENNHDTYVEEIFTPTSSFDGVGSLSGKRDMWLFPKCEPMCGKSKNSNGKDAWQVRQEVVRLGAGFKPNDHLNDRRLCTIAENQVGKESSNQANGNDEEKIPPGVTSSNDGGGKK